MINVSQRYLQHFIHGGGESDNIRGEDDNVLVNYQKLQS